MAHGMDRSGSMSGKPWNDLMNAVNNLFSKLEGKTSYKLNSRISVIAYNSDSKIIFENQ